MPCFVYILRCSDGSFYVGHTDSLTSREQLHNDGNGARYTAARRPVRLIHSELYSSLDEALARERQLKGWNAAKKAALVAGEFATLKKLSKRRGR